MIRYRKQPWFTFLSVMLLVVFVQAQASGCCTLGSRFHVSASALEKSPAPEGMEHACCAKRAAEDAAAPSAAEGHQAKSADHPCCLQGADLNLSGLASVKSEAATHAALPVFPRILGSVPTPVCAAASPALPDSGPPAYRATLPLLI
jgi:hypothetical protein